MLECFNIIAAMLSLSAVSVAQSCPSSDAFEPNDDCVLASTMELVPGLNTGLTATPGDTDWYRVTVPVGARMTADADFAVPPPLPAFFSVADSSCGSLIAAQGSDNDLDIVVVHNLDATPIQVVLVMAVGPITNCADYTIEVTFDASLDPCVGAPDDSMEPNDSCDTAVGLAPGFHGGLRVAVQDEDWYRITIPPETFLSVTGDYSNPIGVAVAWLFEDDCPTLNAVGPLDPHPVATTIDVGADVDFPQAVDRELEAQNLGATPLDVLLRVVHPSSATPLCRDYSLDVRFSPATCSNPADPLDDGTNCATATTALVHGIYENLVVTDLDPDSYPVFVPSGNQLTVEALFQHSAGNIDLTLTAGGPPCFPVFSSTSQTDNELVVFNNNFGPGVWVQVGVEIDTTGSAEACNTYDLSIELAGAPDPGREAFCFGDGSGTPCPCTNDSLAGGCRNGTGRGAVLTDNGGSFAPQFDLLAFNLFFAPPDSFAVLVSGDNALPQSDPGAGIPAFDGLRCVGGALVRHGVRATDQAGSSVAPWGFGSSPPGGLLAQGGFVPGQTRHFQVSYRDGQFASCATGQNTTNAVRVLVEP